MTIAVYAGTFDPITIGHADIALRAASMFEKVIVALPITSAKSTMFTPAERAKFIVETFKDVPNIEVSHYDGFTVHYAKAHKATVLVRGLRAMSDFEYELQIAHFNRHLDPTIETVFLTAKSDHTFISSTMIREMIRLGSNVGPFVPWPVANEVSVRQARAKALHGKA